MSVDPADPLCLAEGPETGLSVWISTGFETHVALGGMGNHHPPSDRIVLVCRDDDPPQSPADKTLTRALASWCQPGKDVRVATPWVERRGDRSDFNDVLQVGGVDAVQKRIELAINPQPADRRLKRVPLTHARNALAAAVGDFFKASEVHEELLKTALATARTTVETEMWNAASDDVRWFKACRDSVHAARIDARRARREAAAARSTSDVARKVMVAARTDFHTARTVAAELKRADQKASREAKNRLKVAQVTTSAARTAYHAARAAVGIAARADRSAARETRGQLRAIWHSAREAHSEVTRLAAAERAERHGPVHRGRELERRAELERCRLEWHAAREAHATALRGAATARVAREAAVAALVAARRKAASLDGLSRLRAAARRIMSQIRRQTKARATATTGLPPVHGVRVDVGGGKSTEARRQAAIRLAVMRATGDDRTGLLMVPTIDLADEQARLFLAQPETKAAGLSAAVWRGRERPDPDHPDKADPDIPHEQKTTMCLDLDAVADAQEALIDVQTGVCERRQPDGTIKARCEHFEQCGYQKQRAKRADMWIAAHEMIFERKPAAMGKPGFMIIDESAWQDGLIGIGGGERTLSLDTLARGDNIPDAPMATERLRFLRQRMFDALSALPDGPVLRETIEAIGITAESAREARTLEWQRKVDAAIYPGMLARDRKVAVKAVQTNKTIGRLSLLWRAIEDLMQSGGPTASGWAAMTMIETGDGLVRAIELKGRKDIGAAFHVPTLILDATMQPEPLRRFWPALEVTADIAIRASHQHVVQVHDRTYSKHHLQRISAFANVRATLFRLCREYIPGQVLCVIQKEFEDKLRGNGNLPANLYLAHHNAIAGKDGWREVSALVVIGRTAPSPKLMEQLAEALSGEAIPRFAGWYPQVDVTREMADGSYRLAQSDRHPHDLAEACRWSVAESELVQIIGRGRGCNRAGKDPVDIWVLGNMPLPVTVEKLISAADVIPSPGDLMAAEGGVEFTNPTDAAATYPALWSSREAAKKALERYAETRLGTFPYKRLLIRECPQPPPDERPGMVRAIYQLIGVGKKPAVAWFDLTLVPDPAAWLTERLGKLSRFELAGTTANPPELTAMREMTTSTDAKKLARRAKLRPIATRVLRRLRPPRSWWIR